MITAEIAFNIIAMVFLAAGGWCLIRGGWNTWSQGCALALTAACSQRLALGRNPVDVAYSWMFFMAVCACFYWIIQRRFPFPDDEDDIQDPTLDH